MPVRVRGQLIPGLGDALHQVRIVLGDPADNKERRPHLRLGHRLNNPLGVPLDDRLEARPRRGIFNCGDADHVEPVLDVEGQGIGDRCGVDGGWLHRLERIVVAEAKLPAIPIPDP